jgi:hypothetical protein
MYSLPNESWARLVIWMALGLLFILSMEEKIAN